jgi:predicted unusual protein kinase regulating ubiquinone biosynthesis (AarF/ABC1/UbiB family)
MRSDTKRLVFGGAVVVGLVGGVTGWRGRRQRRERAILGSTSRKARNGQLAKLGARTAATTVAHQVRRAAASDDKKVELDAAYELKTAEQVTEALGNMKGVLMKLGQMASYLNDGFPEHLRAQLATLQADSPPMSPDLAVTTLERELGGPLSQFFTSFDDTALASASIGQVHRAVRLDGRAVAVKIQYPGVEEAIRSDLDNTALLTQIMGVVFRGLDTGPFIAELRDRVGEELDYRLEATRQRQFADIYRGHPSIVIPEVHDDLSTGKVLVTDLSPGHRFETAQEWTQHERDLIGETIYRFVFRSFNRHRIFNGDPHPGNYLVERGGPAGVRVTFLDFGLVKEFTPVEMDTFWTMIRYQVTDVDPVRYRKAIEDAGLLLPNAPYSTEHIMEYFGWFYHPVQNDKPFTYTVEYAREALKRTFDPSGEHTKMMKSFNLPPSFVVLNRIQWGLNAVLAQLTATRNWRAVSEELWPWTNRGPSTPMGELEAEWAAARAAKPEERGTPV